ncbi:UNVERIFIED_CONTAM: hypothetical protein GTU68_020764 [Idotea baltica]|nr:hypothetical protein [Idotea baltica]
MCKEQLKFVLDQTNFNGLGEKYAGKVRDCYINSDTIFLITSDRLSAFDVELTTIPFKGEILNKLALNAFKNTEDIIENHIIDVPDPNVVVAKKVEILPIEIIVRGYLSGSALRSYKKGEGVSGIKLREGYSDYGKLDNLIITPSTKAEKGNHDLPISEEEILSKNILAKTLLDEVKEVSLALFERETKIAETKGLILADTKYEFGLSNGKLVLADEIHTLDSSRYFLKYDYINSTENSKTPKMLDKEPIRQWLISKGYMGEGEIPLIDDEKRIEIATHYLSTCQLLLGDDLGLKVENVEERIANNLKEKYLSA